MTVGALCLCLVFALQLRGAEPLATPQRRRAAERQAAERTGNKAEETLDALLYLKDLPRGPAVAPHKKAPQFMLDLFNAVSQEDGIPKRQKDILDGNIVRSFEDKGEKCDIYYKSLFYSHSFDSVPEYQTINKSA